MAKCCYWIFFKVTCLSVVFQMCFRKFLLDIVNSDNWCLIKYIFESNFSLICFPERFNSAIEWCSLHCFASQNFCITLKYRLTHARLNNENNPVILKVIDILVIKQSMRHSIPHEISCTFHSRGPNQLSQSFIDRHADNRE